MRKFWINSIPLLVVFFTLVFGFIMPAIATNCDDLEEQCDQATAAAFIICGMFGNGTNICISFQARAGAICYDYYNHCF